MTKEDIKTRKQDYTVIFLGILLLIAAKILA